VSLIPSTYPTTTTSTNATTNDTGVSVGINSTTTPSPTVRAAVAAVATPTLVQPPSFGGITSATLPTTLPSLSQMPSSSHVPSIIHLTTTTATAAKAKENNGTTTTTTTTGIVIGVTMSLLLLCLVSCGWLYRTTKKKRESRGDDAGGGGNKTFLPMTLSSLCTNANRKQSLMSTRESSNCSIIVEKELENVEEEEEESCQSNEIQEPMKEKKTPSNKPPTPPSRWRRSVMQNHRTTSDPTLSATIQSSNELKSSFNSRRRLSASETRDNPTDFDDLRLSKKDNSNNKTREGRGELNSSPKLINSKIKEAKNRPIPPPPFRHSTPGGIERSQGAKLSSVEKLSTRYNHLSKHDSKIPYYYNPDELKSSMTAKKKTSRGIMKSHYQEK
jgi:hypothetical protein